MEALAVIGGFSVLGIVLAWLAGIVASLGFGRAVDFGQWAAHGAGLGGVLGIIVWVLDAAL